ncbi:hypothetical protein FH609_005260 [Streptomyces sp. 3MP-14]|uniref:WXG100 family type VII secretion target n=1 Tax=Streptomyces mimosae TaxID=2586635 RepID=A0A5N6ALK3_9ACTN|nr:MULTISPECIES: hypothetical protein [Streptomyces]KAB8169707.1 hypothetical protein FH607_002940 [Streptomyces mimosae]KAB8178455.1 hypothetical protein FH609_005260 [Streptomyces sp. 3MP-14]
MPNISITYEDVDSAASAMKTANDDTIRPAKDAAKAAIDDALGTSLVLPETNAAITDQYNILHEQLSQLCDAIDSFADQFVAIKEGMIDFDQQYAENIRNPK